MYSLWALGHKRKIQLTFLVIVTAAAAAYLSVLLYKPPTCVDGKQNQDEVGVDCGGVCVPLCRSQTEALITRWVMPFQVSPGWWSALAYVENPNQFAYAEKIPYQFEIFDIDGHLLKRRTGETFINGEAIVPIFEGRIDVGNMVPHTATFQWLREPDWVKSKSKYSVKIGEQRTVDSATGMEIQAMIEDMETVPMQNVSVVAIVYNERSNAIATSETRIDTLVPREKHKIIFTWPYPFHETVSRVELIPRVPVQD